MDWTQDSNVLCNSNNPQVYALCQKKYTILSASYRVTVLERTAVPAEGEIQCVAWALRYNTILCIGFPHSWMLKGFPETERVALQEPCVIPPVTKNWALVSGKPESQLWMSQWIKCYFNSFHNKMNLLEVNQLYGLKS